jgi:N-acylneuraminate cytidylyltransferase
MEYLVSLRIAIILARGGSKRLPRKNLRELGGRPMLAWSVDAALASGCFDRVLLSTDDEEIAEIGRMVGAEVPFLREAAADDYSPSSEATRLALLQAKRYWGEHYDIVAQLMANCPLRQAQDIRDAMHVFEHGNALAQISAFRFGWMNPWWAARLQEDRQPEWIFAEARNTRSQDLPPLYCPSGALWLAYCDALLASGSFYLPGHTLCPMDWVSAMDIDDENDLRMAEACIVLRQRAKMSA